MHPGVLFDSQQIIRVAFPIYNPAHDAYDIMQDARWGWYNDAGTMRRWAPKCPLSGAAHLNITQTPGADDYFYFQLVGPSSSSYASSTTLTIIRRSTGEQVFPDGGKWLSAGGGEVYDVTCTTQVTLDLTIPSEFNSVQIPSDTATGTQSFTDPRDIT